MAPFSSAGRRRIISGVESLDCARAEDVTAERVGASRWQVQAFRCAVLSAMLRFWVTEREASDRVRNASNWRETVAKFADRLPGEEGDAQCLYRAETNT